MKLILSKAKAMPEGTRSTHGGVPVVKKNGKWIRDTQGPKTAKQEEPKEPDSGEERPWEDYPPTKFIPPEDLPDDMTIQWTPPGGEAGKYRIPKEYIHGGKNKMGSLFIVHNEVGTVGEGENEKSAFLDNWVVTEASTGLKLPSSWAFSSSSPRNVLDTTLERLEQKVSQKQWDAKIEAAREKNASLDKEPPQMLDNLPYEKTKFHDDEEMRRIAKEISEATKMAPGGGLSVKEIIDASKRWGTYLPKIEEEHSGFTPMDWKMAFSLDFTKSELSEVPKLCEVANNYGIDPMMLGTAFVKGNYFTIEGLKTDITDINKYGNPNQGDLAEAVATAAHNGISLDDAWETKFGPLDFDEPEEEGGPEAGTNTDNGIFIPDDMVRADINGYALGKKSIEAAALWCKGNGVAASRQQLRVDYDQSVNLEEDAEAAQYYRPSELAKDISAAYDRMARFTDDKRLYRGTGSRMKWMNMKAGDEVPFGSGSFTRREAETKHFGGAAGAKIIIDADKEHSEEGLYGVDIDAMFKLPEARSWISENSLENFKDEEEVVVRASHLRIKQVDQENNTVYVEPVYRGMQLNKGIPDAESMRIYEVMRDFDQVFNQSLGQQRAAEEEDTE